MPTITPLIRDQDICWSIWRSPLGVVTNRILTPITAKELQHILQGATPPRPPSVPVDYTFVSADLERIFTNGQQVIGPNEMGDVSGWSGVEKSPPVYRAVIQEPGDVPVDLLLPRDAVQIDPKDGTVSTTREIISPSKTRAEKIPTYTIVKNVATKVREQ